jgi:actin
MESGALVIEHNAMVKAGFAGDDAPRAVFSSNVSRQKMSPIFTSSFRANSQSAYYYISDEGSSCKKGLLVRRMSVDRGYINKQACTNEYSNWTPWDDVERILRHTFYNELRVQPEEHPVLLSYNIGHETSDYEKLTQIAFEHFHVPSLCLTNPSRMSLMSFGHTTGTVVNCGAGISLVSSFIDGKALPKLAHTLGGHEITEHLMKILIERGYAFTTSYEREIVRDIKEKLCFASLNFEKDMKTCVKSTELEHLYELPDGQVITIGNERFRAAECLFNPIDQKNVSLQHCVMQVLSQSSLDNIWREIMLQNIVLTGNGSGFKNLDHRLQNELDELTGQSTHVRLTQRFASWIGGSIFACLNTDEWVTKAEYEERGQAIVHKQLKKGQYLNVDNNMLQTKWKNKFTDLDFINY